jgi:hypothetical protein
LARVSAEVPGGASAARPGAMTERGKAPGDTALLLPQRRCERHEDETSPQSDQEPCGEVTEQDAKADADEDSTGERRTAVGVAA